MTNANMRDITVATYNNSAHALAEYFRGIGSRVDDIEKAIDLSGVLLPDVLEIGCGDGRDAQEIVKRVGSYHGFDISSEFIKIAESSVASDIARFTVADAVEFDYGHENYNIVYAFASLLHLDKDEVQDVTQRVHESLRGSGVFYISLKHAPEYEERIQEDQYGTRQFFYYSQDDISQLSEGLFDVHDFSSDFMTVGSTKWIELALVKK